GISCLGNDSRGNTQHDCAPRAVRPNRLFAAECGHGVSPLTRPRARCTLGLAEGVGFEPTERSLNAQRFSRPTGVLPLTCLLATVWTGQGTARAPAAGPARRTRRPRHPQLEKNARKNTRCGGYGSELRFLGPRDDPSASLCGGSQ